MSTKCKRCNAENVFWERSITGKWTLFEEATNKKHFCQDDKLKAVKCKYCSSSDLHWAEDTDPVSQQKKMVLMESYGLPHACDERIAFVAKEKQDKKDKYEAVKKRVNAHADGLCSVCSGVGHSRDSTKNELGVCATCLGFGSFSDRNRKSILATMRRRIWPQMQDTYNRSW